GADVEGAVFVFADFDRDDEGGRLAVAVEVAAGDDVGALAVWSGADFVLVVVRLVHLELEREPRRPFSFAADVLRAARHGPRDGREGLQPFFRARGVRQRLAFPVGDDRARDGGNGRARLGLFRL